MLLRKPTMMAMIMKIANHMIWQVTVACPRSVLRHPRGGPGSMSGGAHDEWGK
jgi:hypothetical protein